MGLSTSDDPMAIKEDVMTSKPFTFSSSKPFQALTKECVLEGKHLKNFRKCFQFPVEMKISLPCPGKKVCAFSHGHVCFDEADFLCGLCFAVHPFIHELLDHFNICSGQLVPNTCQMFVSVMLIWMSIHEESMVSQNEFLYLYYLKPPTHYGYFEFFPWDRNSRVICGLPSSIHD